MYGGLPIITSNPSLFMIVLNSTNQWNGCSPSFWRKSPSRRGEGGEERLGGPLWSPAVPLNDLDPNDWSSCSNGVGLFWPGETPRLLFRSSSRLLDLRSALPVRMLPLRLGSGSISSGRSLWAKSLRKRRIVQIPIASSIISTPSRLEVTRDLSIA